MANNKSIGRRNINALNDPNQSLSDVDIDYRRNKLKFCMQVANLDRGRVKTPEQMEERLQQLFDLCIETGNIPNYENLAVACRYSYS